MPNIKKVHFFYTYIFGLKDNLVSVFGKSPRYKKIPLCSQNDAQDFYDLISNSYPMLCAWELNSNGFESDFLLDNFQGRVCPAWNQLAGSANLQIYFKGDKCHELISAADIFVKLMKYKMIPDMSCFVEKQIKELTNSLFGEKCNYYFMGKKCLGSMVPIVTSQIKNRHLVKHPVFYLVKEDPSDEGEGELVEDSPLFNQVLKEVNSLNGCFKYYHQSDQRMIKKGDKLVAFGERGEKFFNKLEKLGYPIEKF